MRVLFLFFIIFLGSFTYAGGNQMTVDQIIEKLGLTPLPEEGGFYRETYRSNNGHVQASVFGIKSNSKRVASTAIYYLVTPESFSALHRVSSDEVFHFYAGDPAEMIQIDEEGNLTKHILGSDIMNGQEPQIIVRAGVWQGVRLMDGGKWSLMGTTVAPGFEFEDFEIGIQKQMLEAYPEYESQIRLFSR